MGVETETLQRRSDTGGPSWDLLRWDPFTFPETELVDPTSGGQLSLLSIRTSR